MKTLMAYPPSTDAYNRQTVDKDSSIVYLTAVCCLVVALVDQAAKGNAAGQTVYLVDEDQYRSLREKEGRTVSYVRIIHLSHSHGSA